jgi:DNA-binding transcriptional MerR regulator
MNQEKSLSIPDIERELNFGIVTLKFILKRFRPWLSFERIDGHPYYSRNTIPILIKIQESLEAGLLPSQIDQELKTGSQEFSNSMKSDPIKSDPIKSDPKMDTNFFQQPNEDIRVSKDGLTLIKSLFDDIAIQQNRVATAHEKRANAEERKAVAIEKRAEAEEKKAMAMNNIANALQEMNHHRRLDSPTREMVHTAAQVMTLETNQMDLADLEDTGDTEQQDYPEIFNSPDPSMDLLEASEIQMDDLSDLIEEDILPEDPLVDVQNIPEIISQKPEASPHTTQIEPQLDDLAALIDPEPQPVNPAKEEEISEIDDLSRLIDEPSDPAMDDLSTLIDAVSTQASPKTDLLDDLSLLIEDSASLETMELDDLSLLITDSTDPNPPTDKTIEPVDDLSALINDTPSLKPDITPEENLKEYKAAVMKIILGLKTQDLSTKETTRRLNQDGVPTISGKSQWSETAISQIYKFIDSAK